MIVESDVLAETWAIFRDTVPSSLKEDCATRLVKLYYDCGLIDSDDAETIRGIDTVLDAAIDEVCGTNDFDDYNEDDEDYFTDSDRNY